MNEPRVLLQAALTGARDSTKRFYEKLVLTDHGDHLQYTDGKRTWHWRLADQGSVHPDYPVLAGIVLARFGSAVGVGGGSDRIIFVDPDGKILAHYSPQRLVPVELQDLIMPPEIYQPLAARGVGVRREKYVTEKAFYAAHPDSSVTGFSLAFASHPFLWLGGGFLIIVIVVNLILLATGYYS